MLKFANFLVKSQQREVLLDFKQDAFSRALEKEERERLEEVKLDNFILSTMCNDILDEMMDMNSEHIVMSRTNKSVVTKGCVYKKQTVSFVSK
jgi:hypothetical protein